MKGLIIKSPWIEQILEGHKTWEIRGSNTKIRGQIALIKSGSGHVYGTVDLVDCKKLNATTYQSGERYHGISRDECQVMPYKNTHAWVLENPQIFANPVPYQHPMGAVIWVNLDS
ncbi:ASCH domain-containing protein [Pseudalkalibacillus berkeleyi]|uniref:ASCH domain-containing protein n=1 Tax=Pseudalkalibacillus berkeleyi TaxID=1069813 RepID=A0ABS9GUF7_9BACL|nr:ASCH domain-containing protein [Pseudalkalibacillus berkeleyi]MCF6136474.1 ASCH domain-containing protein [Pseudalkalibacillus berkeleyi]